MVAAQQKLIAYFQRDHQVLLYRGGILIILDLADLSLYRVDILTAEFSIESLGADGEERCVKCQGIMHLEPRDTERHHNIGHSVCFGEQIADLGKGINVPIRHIMGAHRLFPTGLKAALLHLTLTDRLHDLKGHLGVKSHLDEIEHNIVTAAHRFQNGSRAANDQITGITQPHIGAVGEAGQANQRIEILGLGIHQHTAGKTGVELRDRHRAGGTQQLVIFKAQHLGGCKDAHGIGVVQRNGLGVDTGQILQHFDHGGVIVSQHIQLQQVVLHTVILKMGGHRIGILGIGRMLNGSKVLHIHIVGNNHQTAGVLTGGTAHTHAALRQAVRLRVAGIDTALLQILLHEAESRLFRQSTDGTGTEHLCFAEHLDSVAVGAGLVFAGEVEVDIGHLTAAVAEEGLKGDIKAVFNILCAADGADLIGHISAAAVAAVGDKLIVAALGAAIMGRQGVDLRDTRHICHQRRADGASGAHQIAVLQTALHQLLRRHIHHVVLAQNAAQLHLKAIHDQLGRFLTVQLVALIPHLIIQFLFRVAKAGREQLSRGQQFDLLHHIGDAAGIVHHHFFRFFFTQIGKLTEHFIGGLEVDGQTFVGIGEFLAGQQHVAVNLVLRFLKMDIAGGTDGLTQFLTQTNDNTVELAQLFLRLHLALSQHKLVVAQRLDLQIIVEGRNTLQFFPILMLRHRLEQFARLTGRADDQTLSVLHQLRFGNDGESLEVFQVGRRNQLIQVLQTQLILRQYDDMLGLALRSAAGRAQLQHFLIDLLQAIDMQFLSHLLVEGD